MITDNQQAMAKTSKALPADIQEYRRQCMEMICQALMSSEVGLKRICDEFRKNDPSFPAKRTVRDWMSEDEELYALYSRAKEIQADHIFDEIIEIADTPVMGEIRTEKANGDIEVKYSDMLGRSQLRVDARKWIVSKLLPRKYGDKLDVEHSGSVAIEVVRFGE